MTFGFIKTEVLQRAAAGGQNPASLRVARIANVEEDDGPGARGAEVDRRSLYMLQRTAENRFQLRSPCDAGALREPNKRGECGCIFSRPEIEQRQFVGVCARRLSGQQAKEPKDRV
ncbi:hypothetical protein ACTJI5_22660 [Sphingopyxis sp. 22461]